MYFTDRTSLYLKIQKQFDFWQFTIAMLLALALGLFTMKKPEKDLGFLNRDQTDEVSSIPFFLPSYLSLSLCIVSILNEITY